MHRLAESLGFVTVKSRSPGHTPPLPPLGGLLVVCLVEGCSGQQQRQQQYRLCCRCSTAMKDCSSTTRDLCSYTGTVAVSECSFGGWARVGAGIGVGLVVVAV